MKFYASKISENMHETPEGYLVCVGVPIARTGEMIYGDGETPLETNDEGVIKIFRDEKEVFRKETIASFEGKPVTISHPTEFVSPENWSRLTKGILQNVRRGEGEQSNDLIADILITDNLAINLVKNGLREVSCGYEAEYEQIKDGEGIQTNIIGNHLALVEQGRAGSSYAINDHQRRGMKMKLSDKIKAIFAKAQDEALKVAEDKDDGMEKEKKAEDQQGAGYDELVKMVKDLGEKISAMAPKDAKSDEMGAAGEVEKKSEDEEVAPSLEDRLKALEMSVAKLLEGEAEEDKEEGSEEDFVGDEEEEASVMVGDTASRAEILAPGIAMTKDVKAKALKAAYGTKDGKKAIDALTGGKAPTYDSAEKVETLFIAASELLKVTRAKELSQTKDGREHGTLDNSNEVMSAEKMNEINNKFYKRS